MLDIGWPELMLIAAITVVVVGPREIPRVLRTVNGYVRKARSLASEFHSSIEDMAREADLEDLKKQMKSTTDDFSGDFEKSVDPTGDVTKSMRDLKDTMNARYSDEKARAPGNSVTPPPPEESAAAEPAAVSQSAPDKVAASTPAPAKKAAAQKAAPKKAAAKTAAAKTGAKKTAAKQAAKKTAAKKTAAKKTAAKKAAAKKPGGAGAASS